MPLIDVAGCAFISGILEMTYNLPYSSKIQVIKSNCTEGEFTDVVVTTDQECKKLDSGIFKNLQ